MKQRILFSLMLVAAIVVLDQVTKYCVRVYIHPSQSIEILPILNLVNIRNEGAAFGLFKSFGNTFFIVVSVAAVVFMSWVIVSGYEDWRVFSLLMGGAIGNLIDRLSHHSVVDFLDVYIARYHWPAFNVADSALTIGIFFLFLSIFRKK